MQTNQPFIYREEILKPFFDYIKSGESFYLVGAASSGKTRFLDLVIGIDPDLIRQGKEYDRNWVKNKYLGQEESSKFWLIRVDVNRISMESNWGFQFYELLLHSVLLACNQNIHTEKVDEIKAWLADLDAKVITSKDELMAHRLLEMAIQRLCQIYNIKLSFLFDEFDEAYRNMPVKIFSQLRGIRDANKYQVVYVLSLRNLPEKLRPPVENESFFELFYDRMIGLGFYSKRDVYAILEKWESRIEKKLLPEQREWVWDYCGGHTGIARALFNILSDVYSLPVEELDANWLAKQDSIEEEFRKLWIGLTKDEQKVLEQIALGMPPKMNALLKKQLIAKSLIKPLSDHLQFFTPLFGFWLKQREAPK